MPLPEVLTATEVAQILGTSVQAVRSAVHRGMEGITIPPSIKLGRRRRWLRRVVYTWLQAQSSEPLFDLYPYDEPDSERFPRPCIPSEDRRARHRRRPRPRGDTRPSKPGKADRD
ncbi:MAG: helix-turn-helix domain-containing protein [Gammaproteobacteria bacterium]|nr:helix-turn-helix domain-containing protein [Gammaproteobacteria bacterium]